MHLGGWLIFTAISVLIFGVTGLLQKLSTNHLSAEAAMILLVAGLLVLEPFVYPGASILRYSGLSLLWGLLSGTTNALGCWALLAAMKNGGKASTVTALTSLYPLVLVLVAPFVLHESLTRLQFGGVLCSLAAAILLAVESGDTPTGKER